MNDARPSLRDSGPDPADPVAAYLEEVRKRAALTKPSAHGYTPRGEQLPGGPADDWLIANLEAAADVPRLLAAVEAALGLAPHWERFGDGQDAQSECAKELREAITGALAR